MSEKAWVWYLRFLFIGGGTLAILGIFELVFSPSMMAVDTPEGVVDMSLGALVLMAGLWLFSIRNPKWAIAELQKAVENSEKVGK